MFTCFFLVPYILGVLLFIRATLTTHPLPSIMSPDYGHLCRYCKKVVPNGSKHCRMCNKCRIGFDHHCRFINNCVTKSNYFVFFFGCLFLVTSAIMGIVQLIIIAIKYKTNYPDYIKRLSAYYEKDLTRTIFWVIYGITFAFDIGLAIPMSVLICYHIFFQLNGITTYDYIMDNITQFPQRLRKFACISKDKKRIGQY